MKRTVLRPAAFAAGLAASALGGAHATAQSADALLNKLVDKGILTAKEANELRAESDQGFRKAYQVKSGMPDWVTALKLNGDFRGRYEGFYGDDSDFTDRNRFRYRARIGFIASLANGFEVGLRLGSGDIDGGVTAGTDPISQNQTLQNNGSKKGIFIDLAYGKWNFLNTKEASGSVTIGKMSNPFLYSPMVFDHDYTPEGVGLQMKYRLNEVHSLNLNGGAFILDELSASSRDPYLLGAQAGWAATWSERIASTVGLGVFNIFHSQNLQNGAVPNINAGNTRDPVTTEPAYHFNPAIADADLTYTFEEVPIYKGPFPAKLTGQFLINPAAPWSAGNKAWEAGVQFGKAGKKGMWEIGYAYRYLGANSWYEEFTDSDFGAYYPTVLPGSGQSANSATRYAAGTNVRGHIIRAGYSPYDSITLNVTYFMTSLIVDPPGAAADTGMGRLQADVIWKF